MGESPVSKCYESKTWWLYMLYMGYAALEIKDTSCPIGDVRSMEQTLKLNFASQRCVMIIRPTRNC